MKDRVSFVCPRCSMLCGWDEKRRTYNAVEVATDHPNLIQYAHLVCPSERHGAIATSARGSRTDVPHS